ncbi:hypothetical protein [Methylobacterium iners]|uniref:Uncharacterized protein n=1 Tax=Methylobacterium iners TaxID=418707 RepID=A0ABQ4RUH9_9HYPH|nr:hypothetical protein [Methylobacterium iners]GJD93359.1 hypothetical protein OCOJLMKI_0552 [Methylobacterium iners]
MTTLADLLTTSRAFEYRTAVVDALKAAFSEIEVKALPARLDIADLDRKDMFSPPSFGVAIARIRPAEDRMSGLRDVPVEIVVYVVVEDRLVGDPPRLAYRDELGLALCDAVLALVETPAARWGLPEIGMPEDAEARPILNVMTEDRGTAYFAVTWWQILYAQGQPFMDMESPVPLDAMGRAILPGDPDWVPPAAGGNP